jgi:hypothetical protein
MDPRSEPKEEPNEDREDHGEDDNKTRMDSATGIDGVRSGSDAA